MEQTDLIRLTVNILSENTNYAPNRLRIEISEDEMCEALKGADSRVEERHGRIEDSMDPFMVHILRDKVREHIRGSTPVKDGMAVANMLKKRVHTSGT
jgi:hypothetical protein